MTTIESYDEAVAAKAFVDYLGARSSREDDGSDEQHELFMQMTEIELALNDWRAENPDTNEANIQTADQAKTASSYIEYLKGKQSYEDSESDRFWELQEEIDALFTDLYIYKKSRPAKLVVDNSYNIRIPVKDRASPNLKLVVDNT